MIKQHRYKIFSALTAVCLSLTLSLLMSRKGWAQQSSETETATLVKQLENENVQRHLEAVHDLDKNFKYEKAKPEAVISYLITALKGSRKDLRLQSAITLGWIGPPAKSAVPAFIALLKHSNKDMRHEAATALGQIFGQLDAPDLGILPYCDSSDSDMHLRETATNALISAAEKDSSEGVRQEATSSLRNMEALGNNFSCGTSFRTVK